MTALDLQNPISLIVGTTTVITLSVPMDIVLVDSKTIKLIPRVVATTIHEEKKTQLTTEVTTPVRECIDQGISFHLKESRPNLSKDVQLTTEVTTPAQGVSFHQKESLSNLSEGGKLSTTVNNVIGSANISGIYRERAILLDRLDFNRIIEGKIGFSEEWYYFNLGRKLQFIVDKSPHINEDEDKDEKIALMVALFKEYPTSAESHYLVPGTPDLNMLPSKRINHLAAIEQCLLGRAWQFLLDKAPLHNHSTLDKLDLGEVSCKALALVDAINYGLYNGVGNICYSVTNTT